MSFILPSIWIPKIPTSVFEELLVNALIHRDYLVNATIRLFIFDDRIEIIGPGHLPNNLTVEKIRSGISNIRNPILVSYVAKGLLPYKGLGSGIKRAGGLAGYQFHRRPRRIHVHRHRPPKGA